MASLRDADSLAIHAPVVSFVPRSTTGYMMASLRDIYPSSKPEASNGSPSGSRRFQMVHLLEAGGFKCCSRWLSEAIPPDPDVPVSRTPSGAPSIRSQPHLMASLRDADSLAIHAPVVSPVPRSTTGYMIGSLRDIYPSSEQEASNGSPSRSRRFQMWTAVTAARAGGPGPGLPAGARSWREATPSGAGGTAFRAGPDRLPDPSLGIMGGPKGRFGACRGLSLSLAIRRSPLLGCWPSAKLVVGSSAIFEP